VTGRIESVLERCVLVAFLTAIAGCAAVDPVRFHLAVDTSDLKCNICDSTQPGGLYPGFPELGRP